MPQPTAIETLVGELEIAVDRVRSLYEQYFMGIEKLEPTVPRKDVDRKIHMLRKEQIRNTAQRFRFQMILQRYNTYQTHWQRICREMENGTYTRHVIRAQRRFGEATNLSRKRGSVRPPGAEVLGQAHAAELAELDREFASSDDAEEVNELDLVMEEAPAPPVRSAPGAAAVPPPGPVWRKTSVAATATPPAPRPIPEPSMAPARRPPPALAPVVQAAPPAKPAPTAPRAPGDLPDERVRALYAQYVEEKRRQKESTAAITYDAVARSLRESSAKLREKHGKAVDFEVAVRDGKTILKPVLK